MKTCGIPAAVSAVASLLFLSPAFAPLAHAGPNVPAPVPTTDALASRLSHLTLDDAIDIAIHRNPAILNQLQEIQRNQGVLVQVRAAALPQVIGAGTFTGTDRSLLTTSSGTSGSGSNAALNNLFLRTLNPDGTKGVISGPQLLGTLFGGSNTAAGSTGTTTTGGTGSLSSLLGGTESEADRNYTVTVEVQQTLYNAAIPPQIRQARFQRDAAYYTLRETVDTTINTVKTDFYTVLVDKALIDIQNENLRLLQSQLTDQQNRFAAGTVPRFDVLQASVAVSNQRPNVITAGNTYSLAFIGLARTLGIEYGPQQERTSPIHLVGNLDYHPQSFSADAGVAAGKANRALLKQQRLIILSQIEAIRAAAAGYQPVLTAQGGYELENDRVSDNLGNTVHGWFYGGNFNWNIFDGLATYGRVKQARALLREARIAYEDDVNEVVEDIQNNYLTLQQSKELIASQVLNVGEAEEAVRLAQARLSAGAGTQLDVLQSQTQLLQAQTTELQARYNYAVTLANYERVTGTSTVYDEAFNDPLTTRAKPSGVDTTGAPHANDTLPLGTVKTPDTSLRGSGRPITHKINAQDPDKPARTAPPKPLLKRDYLLQDD